MNEQENFIQLKKDNILKIGIKTFDGKATGEYLEFDLEDIDLALRLNECEKRHKNNIKNLKYQYIIIDKKQDKKGKNLVSWKEEEKLKALKKFYEEEEKALDLFLGKNGTKKILNGRKPYYSMYEDISEILEPILPKLKIRVDDITAKIEEKYSKINNESNVLKQ